MRKDIKELESLQKRLIEVIEELTNQEHYKKKNGNYGFHGLLNKDFEPLIGKTDSWISQLFSNLHQPSKKLGDTGITENNYKTAITKIEGIIKIIKEDDSITALRKETKEKQRLINESKETIEKLEKQNQILAKGNERIIAIARNQPLYNFVRFTVGLFLGLFLMYFFMKSKNTTDSASTQLTQLETININQYKEIQDLNGIKTEYELCKMAVELQKSNMEIRRKYNRDKLTTEERKSSIENMMIETENVLSDNRNGIRKLNLLVDGKRNIADFVNFITRTDSLFKYNAAQLEKYEKDSLLSEMKSAHYDLALLEIKEYILEPTSVEDIYLNIGSKIEKARIRYQKYSLALFECYLKYGEPCFDEKKKNLGCYVETGKLCPKEDTEYLGSNTPLQDESITDNTPVSVVVNNTIENSDPTHSIILDPSFEERENGDFRHSWKNKHLGGLFQPSDYPFDGKKSAKLPKEGDRIGYQEIRVEKNKDYALIFYYTMRETPKGNLTVSILKGGVNDREKIKTKTIVSTTLNDQSDYKEYKKAALKFNSGNNSTVSIYFSNKGAQCWVDAFSLKTL